MTVAAPVPEARANSFLTLAGIGKRFGGTVALDAIDWSVEPGVFAEFYPTPFLRARVEIRHGVNGHHGFVGTLGADYIQPVGAFVLSIGPRFQYGDESFARKYFSVSPLEAALNGPWSRARQPGIPDTVEAIVAEGITCAAAGACILHVHACDGADRRLSTARSTRASSRAWAAR